MKDIWKTLAISSLSCVVLMVSFWLVEVKDYVTRVEASQMIQTQSPYLVDKQVVLKSLNDMTESLRKNTEVISELNRVSSHNDRIHLMECLFEVAIADGEMVHGEAEEIRRITKALRIPHKTFIEYKVRALDKIR